MESGLNSDTVQVEVLPEEIVAAPVFVDSTGKRRRRLRTVGFLAGGIGAAYAAMLGLSFAGGPVAPNALLPIPGVPTVAPLAVAEDKPESSLSAVSSDQKITRGDSGNRADRIGATSTTTPKVKQSGTVKPPASTKPSPTPTKPSATPSKSPSPVVTTPPPVVTTPPPVVTTPPPVVTTPPPADPTVSNPPPAATSPASGGTGAGGGGSEPKPPADPPANPPADPPASGNPPAPTTAAPTATPESTTES